MNNQVTSVGNRGLTPPIEKAEAKVQKSRQSFEDTLKKFVSDVNSLQNQASASVEKMVTGEVEDIHQVMDAVAEAQTAMEFMVEIRNKILEAYQEIMRMPV